MIEFFKELSLFQWVLIGGGVGVTPLMSMIRTLKDQQWDGQIYAVFGFQREKDALFLTELMSAKGNDPRIDLHIFWSSPDRRRTKPKGFITPKFLKKKIPNLEEVGIYVCGPAPMMSMLERELPRIGISKKNLNFEAFITPQNDTSLGGEFEIFLKPSGVRIISKTGESILETTEREGVGFDYSCRMGTCGLCRTTLIEGEVNMLNNEALTKSELAEGQILTCQSYPKTNCVIER